MSEDLSVSGKHNLDVQGQNPVYSPTEKLGGFMVSFVQTIDERENNPLIFRGFSKTTDLKRVKALTPLEIGLWAMLPHPPDALEEYQHKLRWERDGIKFKNRPNRPSADDRDQIQLHDTLLSLFTETHGLGTLGGYLIDRTLAALMISRAHASIKVGQYEGYEKNLLSLKGATAEKVEQANRLKDWKEITDTIFDSLQERDLRAYWAIAAVAEEIQKRDSHLPLPESISNPTAAEIDVETRRFSDEARQQLKAAGYFIHELTGKPMNTFLEEQGRPIDSRWQRNYPGLGTLRSLNCEVAINPDEVSRDRQGRQELLQWGATSDMLHDIVNEQSSRISEKIPGVKAIVGGVADHAETAIAYSHEMGETSSRGYYVPTGTKLNGYVVCVNNDSEMNEPPRSRLKLSTWPTDRKYVFLWCLPLIVPAQIEGSEG